MEKPSIKQGKDLVNPGKVVYCIRRDTICTVSRMLHKKRHHVHSRENTKTNHQWNPSRDPILLGLEKCIRAHVHMHVQCVCGGSEVIIFHRSMKAKNLG